jgi:hypothetical protein
MSEKDLVAKLKQRGYWKVQICPRKYVENAYSYTELKEIVKKCRIGLRGWDYPHIDNQNTYNRAGYTESYCEHGYLIEYWRFYRSAKFIHLFGMREDGRTNPSERVLERFRDYAWNQTPPEGLRGLSILGCLYSLTEIFEYGMNLSKCGVLNSGADISLDLYGLQNRMLYFEESLRDLEKPYISLDNCLRMKISFDSGQHLIERGQESARNWFVEIAQQFQWETPLVRFLVEEQNKFLEKRH